MNIKSRLMKKIVIAADSFKGSIRSSEFADVCAEVARDVMPQCEVVKVPLGDGGEGTVDALTDALKGVIVECEVSDPLGRPVVACYGISGDGKTAIMEMSQASGLPLVSHEDRNPLKTTTFGTGEMVADALSRGCRKIVMGIGGSATNDGGIGMLAALGFRFLDCAGRELTGSLSGADMIKIADVDMSNVNPALATTEFVVACDVDNPFCGELGAAFVFAAQKGADDDMIRALDAGMSNYAGVILQKTGTDVMSMPGAGAAGGLGGAMAAFLGGKLMPGIEMVLETVGFDSLIDGADLIITGEGRIDSQTVHGKTPYGVLQAAKRRGIPVIALGGSVIHSPELDNAGFAAIFSIQQKPLDLEEALRSDVTRRNIASTFRQVLQLCML